MNNAEPPRRRIFAIVLAAGASRRYGSPKQLAVLGGESLVHRSARLARASCGRNTAIVVGHRAMDVFRSSDRECQFLLVNDRYDEGLGTSISHAARALGGAADALLFLLADQPLVAPDHLRNLMSNWSGDDRHIVASRYNGASGPPILLPKATYPSLRRLRGDTGARVLLDDDRFRVTRVALGDAGIDIDVPADLDRLGQGDE